MGQIDEETAWTELVKHDSANHVMCCWTSKDPAVAAGRGASGEVIAGDGIVKGHAYSLISAREIQADGQIFRVLQLRNPWGANPAAEWKGMFSDHWPGWSQYPELAQALEMGQGTLDGMFWMSWDDFRRRYSDIGVVPKQMEVPRMGVTEGASTSQTAKHGKKFTRAGVMPMAGAPMAAQYAPAESMAQYAPAEPMTQYVQAAPAPAVMQQAQYVQPSRTVYGSSVSPATMAYAAAPAMTYAGAPGVTYAAAPSTAFSPTASMTYYR